MRLLSACLFALTTVTLIAGCSSGVTETGYEPHRLGMSDGQRKALYAPKYSPEAAQAQSETEQATRARKPGGFLQ